MTVAQWLRNVGRKIRPYFCRHDWSEYPSKYAGVSYTVRLALAEIGRMEKRTKVCEKCGTFVTWYE